MTQLEFISGMKRLSSYYLKELTNDQLEAWYEMFKEVRIEDFNKAIKLISKENGGLSSARNCGIQNASGDYIILLDSDDYIAYDWVLDNVGGEGEASKWGKYDKAFQSKVAEARKQGRPSSEGPFIWDVYTEYMDNAKDSFSVDLRNKFVNKDDVQNRLADFQDALKEELDEAAKGIKTLGASIENTDSYELTFNGERLERHIVSIKKVAPTNHIYPRKYAQVLKKPL